MRAKWSARILLFVIVVIAAVVMLSGTALASGGEPGWGWQDAVGYEGPCAPWSAANAGWDTNIPPGWSGG